MALGTAIPLQTLERHGDDIAQLTWTTANAATDHNFDNSGGKPVHLLIKNDDAASKTITVVSVADRFGRSGDLSIVVPANSVGMAGPFPAALWNQSDGTVSVTITADTSLTFAAVKSLETEV